MPIFMDTHEGAELPEDLREVVASRVRSGERDAFGVMDRGVILDRQASRMHCVLEAPDRDAVVRHHEAFDVRVDPAMIHEADAILR